MRATKRKRAILAACIFVACTCLFMSSPAFCASIYASSVSLDTTLADPLAFLPRTRYTSPLTSRFGSIEQVEMTDISVASLDMDPNQQAPVQVITLTTETTAPRVAKVQPSKSAAAAPSATASLLVAANATWRATALTGMETGYVNLDGTTRSNVETPAELKGMPSQPYRVTFYCACMECCGKTNAITASGEHATAGVTVAAASNILFGTRIWIEGYGERVVQDRGGAIGLNRLDVYVNTHEEALSHGSRTIQIWFL